MIYHGKQLYLKDLLLPDYTDAKNGVFSNKLFGVKRMRVICGVIL
jgi:hypothetical protein